MSLYKRNDSPHWWVKLTHGAKRIQRSTGISERRKAQEYHDRLKASLWDQEKLGARPSHTWNEAVVHYLRETSHKASCESDRYHLRWLHQFFDGVELGAIDRLEIERITTIKLDGGLKNASVVTVPTTQYCVDRILYAMAA